jgi:glycosyltransferase involved in cell wall biosynthesis
MSALVSDLVRPEASATRPRNLLIEGWRGINHSFALINQHQILALARLPGLRLHHRDLPFAFAHWNKSRNDAGFATSDRATIDALAEPGDAEIDAVYRIAAPFRAGADDDRRRTVTFMITELGLAPGSFDAASHGSAFFTRDDNAIVTSSSWSRSRIIEYGFAPDRVHVIPLGADTETFFACTQAERALSRANLGIHDDETVFVNIGVAVWNKGIDLLLRAFAILRARGRRVRLVLKDQRDVYGLSVEHVMRTVADTCPALRDPTTVGAISVIPGNIDRTQLRLLYGIADCYVSPYRAEGFNLPVLEAIACGKPVIVTRGGATDDFCDDDLACRIEGRAGTREDQANGSLARFIEPNADELIAAMDGFAQGNGLNPERFAAARARMLQRFNWTRAASQLAALTVGLPDAEAVAAPKPERRPPSRPRVTQRDILDLVGMLRPRAMAHMGKIRIGNAYDGGYVLPANALDCDGVLSIGIGTDVSFDLALAERGARVLQLDHTVAASPVAHAHFRFLRRGWGCVRNATFLDFPDILAEYAPIGARRSLLKFDIEGAEYEVIETAAAADLANFEVIACELHDLRRLAEPEFYDRVHRTLARLTEGHVPVHLHANNYRGVAVVEGVPIPDVIELSLLRCDLDRFPSLASDPIPGPLDRPNHPLLPDICMNAF